MHIVHRRYQTCILTACDGDGPGGSLLFRSLAWLATLEVHQTAVSRIAENEKT